MAQPARSAPAEPDDGAAGASFEALADPNRRALIEMMRSGDQSVQAMADRLPISRPAVSRHLRVLKDAGLVAVRAEGTRRLYRLDGAGIEVVRRYVDQMWGDAITRFTMFAENTAPDPGRDDAER